MRQIVRSLACIVAIELARLSFGGAGDVHAHGPKQVHATTATSAAKIPADDDFDDVTAYIRSLTPSEILGLFWPVALVCVVLIALKIGAKRR